MITEDEHLKEKFLKDKYNSIIFEEGRDRKIYLVGGYVRDMLLGVDSSDRDYIFSGNIKSFVNEIKNITGGTIVEFKKGNIVRLAFKEGITLDFSEPQGTLEEDLSKRDFTVNAIAWSPVNGIVDIHNGIDDIKKKTIKAISKENFVSDPLRMLRAYRFAAEIQGSIEQKTRQYIKLLHSKINEVTTERITLEIFHLLNSECSEKYLKLALDDGILTSIISFSHKVLEDNIRGIIKLERHLLKDIPQNIKVILNKIFSQNITYKGLLCLEILLKNSFLMNKQKMKIKISANMQKRLELTSEGMLNINKTLKAGSSQLFDLFMRTKEASVDLSIIKNRLDLLKEYKRFQKIWKNGLMNSNEIIQILNLKPGPEIGKIITEVKRAHFIGRVKSKKQALKFIEGFKCN